MKHVIQVLHVETWYKILYLLLGGGELHSVKIRTCKTSVS